MRNPGKHAMKLASTKLAFFFEYVWPPNPKADSVDRRQE